MRAHSHVWHDFARKDHPALLGCVVGPDKRFHGIWRIFTDLEGNKADIEQVKMGLGRPDGGSVWIASQDQMEAEIWGVCEGIETALSIRELFHDLPVFAALSTSGMMNFEIPPHVKFLVIFPDGDLATRNNISGWNIPPGELAARKLSERLKESNFSHEIIKPPQHSDWNDVLVDAVSKGLR
ncbi:MAG: toprim domain-containing protein [Cohaesibacter sp.]|nr:toprim domain-containing protein [Cohaesibacter sp.]